ncbi:MAG: hypothetical protein B7Z77_04925 [Acidocella sp. 20-58-15]|nr:MAG: hypothetical protein B7Z77_04925 [Acidocella sp. 20-58-15]
MRISCPGCQTEYDVPDVAFNGRPRTVRCQQCNHQWLAEPAVASPPPAWPAAGPSTSRSVYDDMPKVMERPSYAPPTPEPAPRTPTWPSPAAEEPAHDPFTYSGPSSTAEILASLARNSNAEPDPDIYAEPSGDAESSRGANSLPGNEERFAALVKSSRPYDEHEHAGRSGIFTTIIILIFVFGGIYAGRAGIMHAIPASTPFFNGINHIFGIQPAAPK